MNQIKAPTVYKLDSYSPVSGLLLQGRIANTLGGRLHWRDDPEDRIAGGMRRTFLLHPNNVFDRLLFGGGVGFREAMDASIHAANEVMRTQVGAVGWSGNRVVVNRMPPHTHLPEHVDPSTYKDGVVVISLAKAAFSWNGGEGTVETDEASMMHIPAGLSHRVENGDDDRFSIAVIHDTQLERGGSIVKARIVQVLSSFRAA